MSVKSCHNEHVLSVSPACCLPFWGHTGAWEMEAWLAGANARSQHALPTHSCSRCCQFCPTPSMRYAAADFTPLPACSVLLPVLPHSQHALRCCRFRPTPSMLCSAAGSTPLPVCSADKHAQARSLPGLWGPTASLSRAEAPMGLWSSLETTPSPYPSSQEWRQKDHICLKLRSIKLSHPS